MLTQYVVSVALQCVQALKNWGVPQGIRHPGLIYAVKEQALAAK